MRTKHRSHRTPLSACPACKATMDAARDVNDDPDPPTPGNLSVCFSCGAILEFLPDLSMRLAPGELLVDVARNDPETWALLRKMVAVVKEKNEILAQSEGTRH